MTICLTISYPSPYSAPWRGPQVDKLRAFTVRPSPRCDGASKFTHAGSMFVRVIYSGRSVNNQKVARVTPNGFSNPLHELFSETAAISLPERHRLLLRNRSPAWLQQTQPDFRPILRGLTHDPLIAAFPWFGTM